MNLERLFDAESETLSLTDVKEHLRITGTDDDDVLREFIIAIRKKTEKYIEQTLVKTVWELKLDCFEDEITLPMPSIQSITSINYVDTNGDTQAFTNIQYDKKGRLKPSFDNSWPSTRDQYDAVTIVYVAGRDHAGKVEQDIKLAMKLWIGACDLSREDNVFSNISEIPNGAKSILDMHRELRA